MARFETFISRDSLPYFDTRPLQEILAEAEGASALLRGAQKCMYDDKVYLAKLLITSWPFLYPFPSDCW